MPIEIPLDVVVTFAQQMFILFLLLAGLTLYLLGLLVRFLIIEPVWLAVMKLGVLFSQHKQ